jgi:hypothetical protein
MRAAVLDTFNNCSLRSESCRLWFLTPNVIRDSGIVALASVKSLGASGEMATSGMITPEQGLRYAMSLKLAKNSFFQASAGLWTGQKGHEVRKKYTDLGLLAWICRDACTDFGGRSLMVNGSELRCSCVYL